MAALAQPKKPPTQYFLWLKEHRADVVASLGGKPNKRAVADAASKQFKGLDKKERQRLDSSVAELKRRYDKDMAEFLAAGGIIAKGRANTKRPQMSNEDFLDEFARRMGDASFVAAYAQRLQRAKQAADQLTVQPTKDSPTLGTPESTGTEGPNPQGPEVPSDSDMRYAGQMARRAGMDKDEHKSFKRWIAERWARLGEKANSGETPEIVKAGIKKWRRLSVVKKKQWSEE